MYDKRVIGWSRLSEINKGQERVTTESDLLNWIGDECIDLVSVVVAVARLDRLVPLQLNHQILGQLPQRKLLRCLHMVLTLGAIPTRAQQSMLSF